MNLCCHDLEDALKSGFLEKNPLDIGEIILPRRNLVEAYPEAKAGNVLTGETYDPASFAIAHAIRYCPFCGHKFATVEDLEEEGRL